MATNKKGNEQPKRKLDTKSLFSYGLKVAQDLLGMTEPESAKKGHLE